MTSIVFAHGLEGSPNGTKIQILRSAGFHVDAPDGRKKSLSMRIEQLEHLILGRRVLLVGSSYGGLAAAYVAEQHPDRLVGLLLLAPALHRNERPVADASALRPPKGVPTILIHGIHDEVVPIGTSRQYIGGGEGRLIETEDDHRLKHSMDVMLDSVQALL
jgi:hypothetical protein